MGFWNAAFAHPGRPRGPDSPTQGHRVKPVLAVHFSAGKEAGCDPAAALP
jgi:hypothetical protein